MAESMHGDQISRLELELKSGFPHAILIVDGSTSEVGDSIQRAQCELHKDILGISFHGMFTCHRKPKSHVSLPAASSA